MPPSASHQRVPRTRYTWNGDVWKAIVEIRTYDNLDTYTVLADQGLGVIKKRDNSDILKLKNINFKKIKFKYYYNNYKSLMRIVTFDEALEKI